MNRQPKLVYLPPESPAMRAAALLAEATQAADQHIAGGISLMGDLARTADEIAAGGETYPVGVREEMRRLANHIEVSAQRVAMIMDRARKAVA